VIVIAVVVYFVFFTGDIVQTVKDAMLQLPTVPEIFAKGL
jgi:hypothetical protein